MRDLAWGGVPNLRDLGGLSGQLGTTRFGRVARGPRRELLDDAGWLAARAWGLSTIVDLRCAYETGPRDGDPRPMTPPDVVVLSAPTEDHANAEFRATCFPILDSPAYWPHHLRILPGLVRTALETIAQARPGVLIHCSAGRDRTGLVTALLLANAGVDAGAIADDYELSVRAMAGTPSHQPTADRQSTWDEERVSAFLNGARPLVLQLVEDAPAHLERIGLGEDDRSRLRALLLDAD